MINLGKTDEKTKKLLEIKEKMELLIMVTQQLEAHSKLNSEYILLLHI